MSTASDHPSVINGAADEKDIPSAHAQHIAIHDGVPEHPSYYEKNGLRTYGDGEDHDHEPPVSPLSPSRQI